MSRLSIHSPNHRGRSHGSLFRSSSSRYVPSSSSSRYEPSSRSSQAGGRGLRRSTSSPSLPYDYRTSSSTSRAPRRQSTPSHNHDYTQALVVVDEDSDYSDRDDSDPDRSYRSHRHLDRLSRSESSRSIQHGGHLAHYNGRQKSRDPRKSLHDTIKLLNLPRGMLASISQTYSAVASRLYIVDNSLAMHLPEGHVAELLPSGEVQARDVSLWVEVKDFINYQAAVGARNSMRTYVWLLNDPSKASIPQKFALSKKGFDQKELDEFADCLDSANPERRECPLSSKLYNLVKCVAKEKHNLEKTGKHIVITVCTQGMPTDKVRGVGLRY